MLSPSKALPGQGATTSVSPMTRRLAVVAGLRRTLSILTGRTMTEQDFGALRTGAVSRLRQALGALIPVASGVDANAPLPLLWEGLTALQWSAEQAPIKARALALVGAIVEFECSGDRMVTQERIDRPASIKRQLERLIKRNSDFFSAAAARRETYAEIGRMYGDRANARAAYAFAAGPVKGQEALEQAIRVFEEVVEAACAATGQAPTAGRRSHDELTAATQHLAQGGYTPEQIVDLLPDGSHRARKHALKRVRNRLAAPDCRTLL